MAGFSSPVAIETAPSNKGTSWRPPIGVDRTNEALDRLTMDFSSGLQPSAPQTHEHHPEFPAEPKLSSLPAEPADADRPAPTQVPDKAPDLSVSDNAVPDDATPDKVPGESVDPAPTEPRTADAQPFDDVDQYLWSVYRRSAVKKDSSGDFTWKDKAAAARMGLVTKQYVIGGMDPDFRELLYNLGHAMDSAGLNWTILSGFRDDYRQGLASGYKAHVGNSFHGGSRATGGYGHGCAADIEASDGESNEAVWKWVDRHGEKFGIFRPMKVIDPAHIQPLGGWHDVAFNLRDKRETAQAGYLTASVSGTDAGKVTPVVDNRSGVTAAQFDCVRSHRGGSRMAGVSHRSRMHRAMMFHGGRVHRFGRRRLVVDAGSPNKRTGRDSQATVADQTSTDTNTRAKAEASDRNRRDARRNKVADSGKRKGKEAALSTKARRNARRNDDDRKQKVAGRRSQKHTVTAADREARAKNHVADRDGASDKNDKEL